VNLDSEPLLGRELEHVVHHPVLKAAAHSDRLRIPVGQVPRRQNLLEPLLGLHTCRAREGQAALVGQAHLDGHRSVGPRLL